MAPGTYISAFGHVGLIGWLMMGAGFTPESTLIEATEVSVISTQDLAFLTNTVAPDLADSLADIATPLIEDAGLNAGSRVDDSISEMARPTQVAPSRDAVPSTRPSPLVRPIEPDLEVSLDQVQPLPQAETKPTEQLSAIASVRPNMRVAPVEAPDIPDVPKGPTLQLDAAPSIEDAPSEPAEETTAPKEATTQTVTEAENPGEETRAPLSSVRPQTRPASLEVETPDPVKEDPPVGEPTTGTSIEDTLAAVLGTSTGEAEDTTEPENSAPPFTAGQADGLKLAIGSCWNFGAMSTEAMATTVVVRFEMDRDSRPIAGSIEMIEFSGGSQTGANKAFEAARAAINECGEQGYGLPVEQYEYWRLVEMVFNPERMRFR